MMSPSQKLVFWGIVWLSVILLSAPTVIVVGASFTAGKIITFPPQGLSLRWYVTFFENEVFMRAIRTNCQ